MGNKIKEIINTISQSINRLFSKIGESRLFHISFSRKTLIIGFSCIVGVLVIISSIILINAKKESVTLVAAVSTSQMSSERSSFESSLPPVESLKANVLLLLTDGDGKINMLSVLRADCTNDTVRVLFIDPSIEYTVNGYDGTLQEHFTSGGINELLWAVGDYGSVSIERYIYCNEKQFTTIIKDMGEYEINIDEEVSHEYKGINFIIDKGQQTLTADTMLKYFLYLCDNIGTKQTELANLLVSYANRMFFADNSANADSSFESVSGNSTTNLSAIDYSNYKSTIINMTVKAIDNGVIVENGFDNFKN